MSGDLSFAGSIEHDLTLGKLWLCRNLPMRRYRHIYVIGSWYGNIGLILGYLGFDFDRITNIDANPRYCEANEKLYKLAGFDRPYSIINGDCNHIEYDDADLIINTSTNDIKSHGWFSNIPKGCMVVIQCRNNQPPAANMDKPATFDEFMSMFRLRSTFCAGTIRLSNSEESYYRYMLIGFK